MSMGDIERLINTSFRRILQQPILIVPYIINALLVFFLVLFVILQVIVMAIIAGISLHPFSFEGLGEFVFSPFFIIAVTVFVIIDLILMLIITSYFRAMVIGMVQ